MSGADLEPCGHVEPHFVTRVFFGGRLHDLRYGLSPDRSADPRWEPCPEPSATPAAPDEAALAKALEEIWVTGAPFAPGTHGDIDWNAYAAAVRAILAPGGTDPGPRPTFGHDPDGGPTAGPSAEDFQDYANRVRDALAARGTDSAVVECECSPDQQVRGTISARCPVHNRAAGAPNFQVSAPNVGTGPADSKSFGDPLGEVTADIEPGAAGAGAEALSSADLETCGHGLRWAKRFDGESQHIAPDLGRWVTCKQPPEPVMCDRDDEELISEARRSADDHEREGWTKAPPLLRRLADRLAAVRAERDTNDELAREHYEEMCRQEDRADNAEDRIAAVRALCDHAETWSDEVSIDAVRSALGSSTGTGEASDGATD